MPEESSVAVLVVGAGPVGLTAALELRRRGVACRVIDKLVEPPQYAKAVGIQPRTLELWEAAGVLRAALDAGTPLRGQVVLRDGEQVARMDLEVPPDVPFAFLALPQYETERLLAEALAGYGTRADRGVELLSFTQDEEGVTAELSGGERVRAKYLVGADGAHSVVRKGLGLAFEGGAFAEEYMLGDVEVDWSLPRGYALRATRGDDLLVAIPLPGDRRYRMSMLVPPDLATPASGEVAHGFEAGRRPELHHIQAVLDRLAPEPCTASTLRWSSVFRISHRIVDSYGRGRVFVAGDAAHIHPPTGAQGMNTGIQDAVGLAWRLALAVDGIAAPGLLATYDAERRPVGEEVVGRTVRAATTGGVQIDRDDPWTSVRREAQLLVGYRGSPAVSPADPGLPVDAPQPGDRVPDARGLVRDVVRFPVRLLPELAGPGHTLLLHAGTAEGTAAFDKVAATAAELAHGRIRALAVLAPDVEPPPLRMPVLRDGAGEVRAHLRAADGEAFLVRPDGYLGHRGPAAGVAGVGGYLGRVFG
ncbi:FAD-dependent monooxygenase [Pseudonocardia kujensis]|uniref:FAD-dependent monooxygenase n=1 Tax=Pseudonocardia kujensis TaxID=1128675 RepID=UPI001E31C7DA|nr:FAD-dependent monooxygenase [Pseudonocardia kujensis]MCE0767866.1 FAD-dependent monooxygenase [Pseudonocardia kujensis]